MYADDIRNQPFTEETHAPKFKCMRMRQRVLPKIKHSIPFLWGLLEALPLRIFRLNIYLIFGIIVWNTLKLRLGHRVGITAWMVHFITLYVFSVRLTPVNVVFGVLVGGLVWKSPHVPLIVFFLSAVEIENLTYLVEGSAFESLFVTELPRFVDLVANADALEPT